jgi:glycolate oxidase iron-sulfur subunit
MPRVNRLRWMARVLRVYERLGLQKWVRGLNILPRNLRAMESLLPPLPARYPDYRAPAPAIGERRGAVAFFYGCIQDAFLADVNAATIRVLQRNGYKVHFPLQQTCCGAAQLHVGEEELTRDLARRNVDAFLADDYDAVIVNAGGCGAVLKEYADLLREDAAYADKARRFVERVKDVNEFLAEHLNEMPKGRVNARVTYVDSCHLRNAQKIVKPPRDLLRAIPGVELIELVQPDRCCGSAGVYNIVEADTANAILDAKMADIAATGAGIIVVTNAGCHLQLLAGVRRAKLNARVAHVVELLDESYTANSEAA